MNAGIYYQTGNRTNNSVTGHIDAIYKGKVGGHKYENCQNNTNYIWIPQ